MLTGMETLDQLTPLAERAMALYREGDVEAARSAGEEFWDRVPQPPQTDGERLAAQLSLIIARRAVPVSTRDATRWHERAREAYGAGSTGGQAQCDFVAGTIAFDEGRLPEARAFFDKAVAVTGPKAFDEEDPKYKAFFDGAASPAAGGSSAQELAEQGEEASDAGNFAKAVTLWQQALAAADPADEDLAFWLYASIGDAQFQLGDYSAAYASEQEALKIGGTGNPFVWLRLGQSAFELGNAKQATDALLSAYMLEGDEIFEDEDPKYRGSLVQQGLIS